MFVLGVVRMWKEIGWLGSGGKGGIFELWRRPGRVMSLGRGTTKTQLFAFTLYAFLRSADCLQLPYTLTLCNRRTQWFHSCPAAVPLRCTFREWKNGLQAVL